MLIQPPLASPCLVPGYLKDLQSVPWVDGCRRDWWG